MLVSVTVDMPVQPDGRLQRRRKAPFQGAFDKVAIQAAKQLGWRIEPKLPSLVLIGDSTVRSGGQNGAFGAGLLNGWTKKGTRPAFKIVTGCSPPSSSSGKPTPANAAPNSLAWSSIGVEVEAPTSTSPKKAPTSSAPANPGPEV